MKLGSNKRKLKNAFFNPRIQLRYYLPHLLTLSLFTVLIYLVLYRMLDTMFIDFILQTSPELTLAVQDKFNQVVMEATFGNVLISLIGLGLAFRQGHRFMGPLVPISRHVAGLINGDTAKELVIRKNDELKDLADSLNQLTEKIRKLNNKGIGMIEVLISVSIMCVIGLGFATFQSNTYKALRSIDQSQETQGMVQGITLGLGTPAAIGPMLGNPTLPNGWQKQNLPKLVLDNVILADVSQQTGKLITKGIALVNLNPSGGIPFAVKVPVRGPTGTVVVEDMNRYMARLDVDYQKVGMEGTETTTHGGSAMHTKRFFLTLTVRPDGTFYSGYGGETKGLFEEMCVGELGGTYDESKSPHCLITKMGLSDAFTDRDGVMAPSANPVTVKGAFADTAGLYSQGAVSAKYFYPGFGDYGIHGGVTLARSWIGKCQNAADGCDFAGDVKMNYLHMGGFTNPDFTHIHNGAGAVSPNIPRVIALVDHVVMPAPGARLGIGLNGEEPVGALHVRHFSGDAPVIENKMEQAALFLRGSGSGAGGTYSAIYLTNSNPAANASGWVTALQKGAGQDLALVMGSLNNGTYVPRVFFSPNGNLGVGGYASAAKFEVAGDIRASGTITAGGSSTSSDERLKKEIRPLENIIDKFMELRPVRYVLRDGKSSRRERIGFVAQEMEKVFPEVVTTDATGMKGIAYGELSAVTVQAIQKLNLELMSLKAANAELAKRLEKLEGRRN